MKRLFCALLALALALCAPAYAANEATLVLDNVGVTLRFPEAYQSATGRVGESTSSELGSGSGIYYTSMVYLGMDEAEISALEAKADSLTDEDYETLSNAMLPLFDILSIDGGRDFDALNAYVGGVLDAQYAKEICKVDDITFYSYIEPADKTLAGAFAEEYAALRALADEVLAGSDYYTPVDPYAGLADTALAFETTDLDGNPVNSVDLFAAHEITMVNIWASWCGPCVNELAELEAINGRLAANDCAVVGLLYDGNKASALNTAKGILAEKGVTYTNILPPENVDELFLIEAFPTSYFVNRDGVIVGKAVVGAAVNQYEDRILSLLNGEQ